MAKTEKSKVVEPPNLLSADDQFFLIAMARAVVAGLVKEEPVSPEAQEVPLTAAERFDMTLAEALFTEGSDDEPTVDDLDQALTR